MRKEAEQNGQLSFTDSVLEKGQAILCFCRKRKQPKDCKKATIGSFV